MSHSRDSFFPLAWRAGARADDPGGVQAGRDLKSVADEVLVRRIAQGDDGALAEIVARYEQKLAQFIRWSLGSAGEITEDVLQEVLLQLHRSASRFAGESSFRTWLYALARNVCRHECRKLRRQPAWMAEGDEALLAIHDRQLSPLDTLTRDEAVRAVRRALDDLPEHHRLVLMLRDWEGLSYTEIAEVLEIPVGTVRSRLHNARAMLGDALSRGSRP